MMEWYDCLALPQRKILLKWHSEALGSDLRKQWLPATIEAALQGSDRGYIVTGLDDLHRDVSQMLGIDWGIRIVDEEIHTRLARTVSALLAEMWGIE